MVAKDNVIALQPMQRERMEIRLIGDSPLVVHKFAEKAKQQMRDKQSKKAKQGREVRNPEDDFNQARYVIDADHDGFPATAFKQAAVNSARYVEGLTMTELWGAFHVNLGHELVPIEAAGPVMREDFVRVGGKGPGTGSADLRYRPEYFPWAITLDVVFNARAVSAEQLINLFSIAGFAIGVGENRPQKKGQWGMFHVATDDEV